MGAYQFDPVAVRDRLVELIDGRIARDEAITVGVEPAPSG